MSAEQILEIGQHRLAQIRPETESVSTWKTYLTNYRPTAEHPDDTYIWLTCSLALDAVNRGNFGVGCILIDNSDNVCALGHNQVFNPYFRSDRHAEMVVMDNFEDAYPEFEKLDSYTLYTSLEPCPMCLVRLSTSNVTKVFFGARDQEGGMVNKMIDLPSFWLELAQKKIFRQANCSSDLIIAANKIFLLNLAELTTRIYSQMQQTDVIDLFPAARM